MKIRPVSRGDLPDIARIQGDCYGDRFIESKASFSAKLSAHSEFSFMALQGERAVGYLVALPWLYGSIPDLNGLDYAIPPNADGLYIHDIAVSRGARNSGVAEQLLGTLLQSGREKGYKQAFLVAVQGAASYWQRHGFEAVKPDVDLRRSLLAYGTDATYMARPIAADPSIERALPGKPGSVSHVKRQASERPPLGSVMFDHVVFGVSDYAESKAFFVKALEPLGVAVVSEGPLGLELCRPGSDASLCIRRVEEKATHLHLAFTAESRQQVEDFHRAALEAGAKDNGAPGLRPQYHANYYAAFVIGPDGHNIEAVCHEPEA